MIQGKRRSSIFVDAILTWKSTGFAMRSRESVKCRSKCNFGKIVRNDGKNIDEKPWKIYIYISMSKKKLLKINSVMVTMCIVEAASPEPEVLDWCSNRVP